eukprot:GILK01005167.1.p1 GENE.GILK01005167.1~~GILK01005167.1.p1  ORF type:complete len:116 (+),score=8.35 GILK01005167.1:48-350(+)
MGNWLCAESKRPHDVYDMRVGAPIPYGANTAAYGGYPSAAVPAHNGSFIGSPANQPYDMRNSTGRQSLGRSTVLPVARQQTPQPGTTGQYRSGSVTVSVF